jgi:hypothetical protein
MGFNLVFKGLMFPQVPLEYNTDLLLSFSNIFAFPFFKDLSISDITVYF